MLKMHQKRLAAGPAGGAYSSKLSSTHPCTLLDLTIGIGTKEGEGKEIGGKRTGEEGATWDGEVGQGKA